jgi:O-antigen/teichoic acid export membrane protein
MSKVAKGAVYLSFSAFLFMLSGYIANIWLGRHFGPQVYGQYGVIIALISLINIMQTSGLPQALAKFTAEKPIDKDGILRSALIIQITSTVTIAGLFALAAPLIARLLKDASLVPYLRLSALVFPLYGIYSIFVGYYNGLHKFRRQAELNGIYAIAKAFGIIFLTILFKLYGAIAAFVIAPIITLAFGFHKPESTKQFPKKKLVIFSLPIIIFSFATTLFLSLDLLFMKSLLSSDKLAAGYYIAAQNIALVIYFCMSAASSVILPMISSNIAQGLNEKASKLINQSLRYMLIVLAPVAALMAATSSQLINVVYSSKYNNGAPALKILLVAYVLLAVFVLFSNVLNGAGKPYAPVKAAVPGLIVSALLCALLIPRNGLVGAAISTTVGAGMSLFLCGLYVWHTFNIRYPFLSIIKILTLSVVLYIVAKSMNVSSLKLPIVYIILGIAYFFALILTKEITLEDRTQIRNILPNWVPFFRWL